ncbi:hypothetical protein ACIA6C_10115 [Streptomyces sp. NPDC051578]|uniref:hypothetical protein n=1 Tax=Streptomyces sp. NPDC051578 TaxID=3365662 RepID=UPI00379BC62F
MAAGGAWRRPGGLTDEAIAKRLAVSSRTARRLAIVRALASGPGVQCLDTGTFRADRF